MTLRIALTAVFLVAGAAALPAMQITVRPPTGTDITIDIEPTDTIQNLKSKVQDETAIPPSGQRLVFGGQTLRDNRTLDDCNIQDDAVVFLLPAAPGLVRPAAGAAVTAPVTLAWYTWNPTNGAAGPGQVSYKLYIAGSEDGLAGVAPQAYGPFTVGAALGALGALLLLAARRTRAHALFLGLVLLAAAGVSCGGNEADAGALNPPACTVGAWDTVQETVSCATANAVAGRTYWWRVEILTNGHAAWTSEARSFTAQ